MQRASRLIVLVATLSLAAATMLSAYGFHGLPGKVPAAKIASWEWANLLHFLHSIGLIVIALLLERAPASRLFSAAAALMFAGLVLFSAGIYAEVLGAPAAIGEVAPFGGQAFILAWVLTGVATYRLRG
ncbi:MAG: DUF423 domain-containing protein [Gammaproteobacteria bacterium]|nr:DUF423 domain-containing protein [Gammaproteobacteria bacterium]